MTKTDFKKQYLNKIVCGSAVDVMKKLPDGSVDLIITSPPYNIKNSTGNGMKDGRGGKWANAAKWELVENATRQHFFSYYTFPY